MLLEVRGPSEAEESEMGAMGERQACQSLLSKLIVLVAKLITNPEQGLSFYFMTAKGC